MARKKPTRTRVQQYRAQRRKSWIRFLTKIALFFVPIAALTLWLIFFILPSGNELPILVLDLESKEQRKSKNAWERFSYGKSDTDQGIEVPKSIKFGGPQKDVLVVFNDLLGSAMPVNNDGPEAACVFVPKTQEEHHTHQFRGLLNDESTEESKQWIPFDEYIQSLVQEIQGISGSAGEQQLKLILAFDIDHPDLPGRLPPQANRFMKLCKQEWEKPETGTRADLANLAPNVDVFVWLSHSEGQMSYYDSDFVQVESFFKRRFERGITGDVIELAEDPTDVFYSDLRDYVRDWVETDAEIHKLSQSPLFLEPLGFDGTKDFPVLRKKFLDRQENGKLFSYATRSNDASLGVDDLWRQLENVKTANHWTLENPLLIQRSMMLLLQMEKLWYVGQGDSNLFGQLKRRLESDLRTTITIQPVQHTLYDALDWAPGKKIQGFDLELLAPVTAPPAPGDATEDEIKKQVDAAQAQRQKSIAQWKDAHLDWSRALSVWKAICDTPAMGVSKSTLGAALNQLDEAHRNVDRPESLDDVDDLTDIYWNEIAYLDRLVNELVWPTEDAAKFEELVLLSIQSRDRFNQLSADLTPALVQKFEKQISELENRRRQNEDRLFANDHTGLRSEFKQLETDLRAIETKHKTLKTNFERIQQQLVSAPHDFRYCLESMAALRGNVEAAQSGGQAVLAFENWNASEQGFLSQWAKLGNHEIGALMERSDQDDEIEKLVNRTTAFEAIRSGWFGAADATDFATNPYIDFGKYNSNPDALGAADGNLLGRRLLLWPGLDQGSRSKIREGLSTNKVTWSGGIRSRDLEDLDSRQKFSDQLAQFFQNPTLRLLTRSNVNEIPLRAGDENYFTQVAFESHRLLARPDDATSQNLSVAINDFRCRKSNFDLQRVASDLWATPTASSQDAFVTSALVNHVNLVDARIRAFPDRLHSTREKLTEIWEAGPKRQWPSRVKEIQDFCADFPSVNWRWDRNIQKAINSDIAPDIARETPKGMPLVFSLSPDNPSFASVFNATYDEANKWIDPSVLNGGSLRLYLRGHLAKFDVQRAPVPIEPVSFEIEQRNYNVPGAQLIVKRANPGPISGHITIVIDCSNSMKTEDRMQSAKRNVNQFLDFIKDRADISVSLVAIGASERFTGNSWEQRSPQLLSKWKKDDPSDVWFFSENGKIVNKIVTKYSVDTFKSAVAQLEFHGDTPILAGLDSAINAIPGQLDRPKLIVLLTDGFEFGHRKNRSPDEPFANFDDELYKKIGNQLLTEKLELVVFSFLTKSIKQEFGSMLPRGDEPGIEEIEIQKRIDRIQKLATINKRASQTSLQNFFESLLPQPMVIVKDEGGSRLIVEREVEKGIDLDRDGQKSDEEQRIMQAILLGADERPAPWSVGVKFTQTAQDNAAKSFSQTPSAWRSETRVAGNEKLEFEFNPLLSTFDLTTDASSLAETKQVQFGSLPLLVGRASNSRKQPGFQLASSDTTLLTPAPVMAFLTMEQSDDSTNLVLVQDFNLKRQTRSNVHPLEFPEFKVELREASFQRNPVDMNLHLIPKFTPQFWTKLYFNREDPMKVQNDQQQSQLIKQGVYVGINELFPREAPFNKYEIQIRRDNQQDLVQYSIRISAPDGGAPIDRWLVQVLDGDGNIDETVNEGTRRTYVFQKDRSGSKNLMAIEHHFSIIKTELKDNPRASFGFANIENLENVDISRLKYQEFFNDN